MLDLLKDFLKELEELEEKKHLKPKLKFLPQNDTERKPLERRFFHTIGWVIRNRMKLLKYPNLSFIDSWFLETENLLIQLHKYVKLHKCRSPHCGCERYCANKIENFVNELLKKHKGKLDEKVYLFLEAYVLLLKEHLAFD